jgi:hypothetical protein
MLRRTVLVAALACAALASPAQATNFAWTPAGEIGLPRYGAAPAVLNDGRVLMVGGRDPAGRRDTNTVERWDPATNAWTAVAAMHESRAWPTAVTLRDGRVLVAGGAFQPMYHSAEIYDPATGGWTRTADSSAPHSNAPAIVLGDGRVLLVGGNIYLFPHDGGEIYDPIADRWTETSAMPSALLGVSQSVVALRDGRILVVGGRDVSAAAIYNPGNDTWTPVTPPRALRNDAGMVTLADGRVLVAGGWANVDGPSLGATARRTAEVFDPATGAWTPTGDLLHPRWDGADLVLLASGEPVYVGGGWATIVNFNLGTSYVEPTAEAYDVATGTWRELAPMPFGRSHQITAPLADGTLLVAGGVGLGGVTVAPQAQRMVPAAPAPAAPAAPVVSTPTGPRPGTLTFAKLAKRLKPSRAGSITVKLRCSGGRCNDRLMLRGRGKLLAQRKFSAAAGTTVSVKLKLSKAARRTLGKRTTRVTLGLLRQGTKVSALMHR